MAESETKKNVQLLEDLGEEVRIAISDVTIANTVHRLISKSDWDKIVKDDPTPPPPPPPPPYPVPTEAVEMYLNQCAAGVEMIHDRYGSKFSEDSELSKYWCLNYDGIQRCLLLERYLSDRRPDLIPKMRQMREDAWVNGLSRYVGGTDPRPSSYLNYNEGTYHLGKSGNSEAMRCALLFGHRATYSECNYVSFDGVRKTRNEWVGKWRSPDYAREFANGLVSHLMVYEEPIPDGNYPWDRIKTMVEAYRDEWMTSVVVDHILGCHIPEWLDMPDPDLEWRLWNREVRAAEGLPYKNWAPFMMGLSARALTRVYYSTLPIFTEEIKSRIVPALQELADFVWPIAWRETGDGSAKREGLFYRPLANHSEGPAPDLNMLCFGWYAFLALETGQMRHYERAEALLRGSRHGAHGGLKQGNQLVLDVFPWLQRLEWL